MIIKVENISKVDGQWVITFDVSSADGINFDFITSVPVINITKTAAIKAAYLSSKDLIDERFTEEESRHINLIGLEIDNLTGDFKLDESSETEFVIKSEEISEKESLSVWEESEKVNSEKEIKTIDDKPSPKARTKSKSKTNKSEVA